MLPAAATSAISTPIDNCPICLEPLQSSEQGETDVVTRPCNHVFHYGCLNRWLYSQLANTPSTCPLDRTNVTAIHTPATNSKTSVANFLVRNNEMLVAAETGNLAKVAELLEQGIDVDAGSASEMTPLQIAAQHYHFEIVDLLLSKGASDPETIYRLGYRLHSQNQDILLASHYYQLAADKEHTEAQYQLAILLTTNKHICHDYAKARTYFKMASDKGHSRAQVDFAYFLTRMGGTRNLVQARKYIQAAADNGNVEAAFKYAFMCEKGLGGDYDYHASVHYYRISTQDGKPDSRFKLARILTLTDSDEDITEARAIYKDLADKGYGPSLNNYGVMLSQGTGGPCDYIKAREVFQLAIEKGSYSAHHNLAIIFEEGLDCDVDLERAIELYQVAAKRGNTAAIERLLRLGLTPPEPD